MSDHTYKVIELVGSSKTSVEDAIQKNSFFGKPAVIQRGNVENALISAPHVIRGELRIGAQDHWYLETQACLCVPGEGREIFAYSSSQHPSETQALIAEILGIGKHDVQVEVRRMGGGFGGKETQANHYACWSALLCQATKRPDCCGLAGRGDARQTSSASGALRDRFRR